MTARAVDLRSPSVAGAWWAATHCLELALWYGVFVPAGTPAALVARLSREVLKAADTAAVKARLDINGGFQQLGSAAELGSLVHADNQRFKALMKDLGLVPAGAN